MRRAGERCEAGVWVAPVEKQEWTLSTKRLEKMDRSGKCRALQKFVSISLEHAFETVELADANTRVRAQAQGLRLYLSCGRLPASSAFGPWRAQGAIGQLGYAMQRGARRKKGGTEGYLVCQSSAQCTHGCEEDG